MMLPTSEGYHEAEDNEARLLELMAPMLSPEDLVLEAGCGRGRWANILAQTAGCRVLGVDIDRSGFAEGCQEAERMGVGHLVEFMELDLVRLPSALERPFDWALSIHSMHEYARPHEVLRAIREVLSPDGRLLVLDYIRGSTAERIWSERYYTPDELRNLLGAAGFKPREIHFPWERELVLLVASR
jgi:ubiquinone/menaquinone biosynthesis C-methylase UbiE